MQKTEQQLLDELEHWEGQVRHRRRHRLVTGFESKKAEAVRRELSERYNVN